MAILRMPWLPKR